MRGERFSYRHEPVLAACGFSGAGKTTLVEAAINRLVGDGLAVAAVKHDAHGLQVDLPHKDSGRLFAAGADVGLSGPGEEVLRRHTSGAPELPAMLRLLLASHDVVLVEGHKSTPMPKVWLPTAEAPQPPDGVEEVVAVLPMDARRLPTFVDLVRRRLREAHAARPLLGCLLLGGRSRRMGRPKQLLEIDGRTMLERIHEVVAPQVSEVVLLGGGEVPSSWPATRRLADAPGVGGPLGGIIAALRWAPRAAWLVVACDLPEISPQALDWLLNKRRPGRWLILPEVDEGRPEPLLAVYEPQALPLLESLVDSGSRAARDLADHPRVHRARVPEALRGAWRNVNTPDDLGHGSATI
jgi:molybdopterin-guanine dinucleotide biosynthesis protein MobB